MTHWKNRTQQLYFYRNRKGKDYHNKIGEEERDSTFFQLRPKLSYDIFHQKGTALPVAPNMLFSWWLTKRKDKDALVSEMKGLSMHISS